MSNACRVETCYGFANEGKKTRRARRTRLAEPTAVPLPARNRPYKAHDKFVSILRDLLLKSTPDHISVLSTI